MTNNKKKNSNLASRLSSLELKVASKRKTGKTIIRGKGSYSAQQANGSYMSGNNFKLFDSIWGGSGAYKIKQNSLYSKTGSQVPVMHSNETSIRFCHREFLGDVSSSVAYTTQKTLYVNPGLASSFPYLAGVANNFQEYRFKGLMFYFKSTGATALVSGTNTSMGSIMLVAQYRADAPVPSGKLELLNEMWSTDCKTSDDTALPIECDPKENPISIQYIRSDDNLATITDQKFYDLCSVTVASSGSQAANVVGELWVSYDVELMKPVMANTTGALAGNGFSYAGNLATTALPYGVQVRVKAYGVHATINATAGTITLPAGNVGSRYLLNLTYTSATTADIVYAGVTNGALVNAYSYNAGTGAYAVNSVENGQGTAANDFTAIFEKNAEAAMVITTSVTIVGATFCDIKIVQVSDDYD